MLNEQKGIISVHFVNSLSKERSEADCCLLGAEENSNRASLKSSRRIKLERLCIFMNFSVFQFLYHIHKVSVCLIIFIFTDEDQTIYNPFACDFIKECFAFDLLLKTKAWTSLNNFVINRVNTNTPMMTNLIGQDVLFGKLLEMKL